MKTIFWSLLTLLCFPVLLLGCRKRRRGEARKILIITHGKLGDVLCTTRMYRAVHESLPEVEVHVLTSRRSSEVLWGNPFIRKIHHFDAHRWSMLAALRREHFDWVINTMPGAFPSIVGPWALAPGRVNTVSSLHGFLVRLLNIFSTHTFSYGLHQRTFAHYQQLLEPLGVRPVEEGVDFFPGAADAEAVRRWLYDRNIADGKFVILGLTAGNAVKEWPAAKFGALADHITGTLDFSVILSTADTALAAMLCERMQHKDRVHDGSSFTLHQLGALCRFAAAFVSVDTGPLYVAYASGTPLVIIIGPIDPREQVPQPGPTIVHVPPPQGCVPWVFIAATPRDGTPEQLRCSRETSLESVVKALEKILLPSSYSGPRAV